MTRGAPTPAAGGSAEATAAMVDGGIRRWNSPIPYLFSGLAFMLGLIAIALLILACSYKKVSSGASAGDKAETAAAAVEVVDNEPKVVVIMAGEKNPTYLAMPLPPVSTAL